MKGTRRREWLVSRSLQTKQRSLILVTQVVRLTHSFSETLSGRMLLSSSSNRMAGILSMRALRYLLRAVRQRVEQKLQKR